MDAPSTAPAPPRPPDERASTTRARGVPRGLVWATGVGLLALAAVAIVWVRTDHDTDDGSGDVSVLDNGVPPPTLDPSAGRDAVGRPAPADAFPRFAGGDTTLSTYRGEPVVVNFFASTCVPCVTEMPELEQVHQRYRDAVAFLGVDVQEQQQAGQRIADATGVTYDLARDPTGALLRALGGSALPTTVLISTDGTIVDVHSGRVAGDDLDRAIRERLLS